MRDADLPACGVVCRAGEGAICERAAELSAAQGKVAEANEYNELACKAGSGYRCRLALTALEQADPPPPPAAITSVIDRGCELGIGALCWRAYQTSVGADPPRAAASLARACEHDPAGANPAGEGGALLRCPAPDPAILARLEGAARACGAAERGGPCAAFGILLRGVDDARAREAFRRECALRGFDPASDESCVAWHFTPPLDTAAVLAQAREFGIAVGLISGGPATLGSPSGSSAAAGSPSGGPAAPASASGGSAAPGSPPAPKSPRARAPKVSVRFGQVQTSGGSADAVRRAVEASRDELTACYVRGLAAAPGLIGRVSVRLAYDRFGEGFMPSNGGSDLPDAGVIDCVVGVVSKTRVTPPPQAFIAVVPLVFTPGP
ncbi:MAG TPA: hypothetical protein VFS43_14560 [Polyangiaceae bacterium]|nr:hypothetical protein [Polyangiaceae bacterium]